MGDTRGHALDVLDRATILDAWMDGRYDQPACDAWNRHAAYIATLEARTQSDDAKTLISRALELMRKWQTAWQSEPWQNTLSGMHFIEEDLEAMLTRTPSDPASVDASEEAVREARVAIDEMLATSCELNRREAHRVAIAALATLRRENADLRADNETLLDIATHLRADFGEVHRDKSGCPSCCADYDSPTCAPRPLADLRADAGEVAFDGSVMQCFCDHDHCESWHQQGCPQWDADADHTFAPQPTTDEDGDAL